MAFVDGVAEGVLAIVGSAKGSMIMQGGPAEGVLAIVGSADLAPTIYITNVRAISSTRLRVDFSGILDNNSALLSAANYTIGGDGYAVNVLSVYVSDTEYPTTIDLIVSEMTDGASYTLSVGSAVTAGGYPVLETPEAFTGKGTVPEIEVIIATSATTVEVRFTESVKDTGGIRDASTYTFTDSLTVEEVTSVLGNIVTLKTVTQTEAHLYTLTVDGTIYDLAGNALTVPVDSNMLGYLEPAAAVEALQLKAYDFLGQNLRDEDQTKGRKFLERYYEGIQEVWKTINTGILEIPNLWSPVDIPARLVQYLAPIVGWNGDLADIPTRLDTSTLRRLIESSSAFWNSRGPEDAIEDIIRLCTGARAEVKNYFDFRWIVDETHLGVEKDSFDPWTISRAPYDSEEITLGGLEICEDTNPYAIAMGAMDALVVFVAMEDYREETQFQPSPIDSLKFCGLDMNHAGFTTSSDGKLRTDVYWIRHVAGRTGNLEWTIEADQVNVFAQRVSDFRTLSVSRGKTTPVAPSTYQTVRDLIESGEKDSVLSVCTCSSSEFGISANEETTELYRDDNVSVGVGYTPGFGGRTTPSFECHGGSGFHLVQILSASMRGDYSGLRSGGEYEYQIRVVDDGTIDKILVRKLALLTRPSNERVEIFYLGFLDRFTTDADESQWTEETGNATVDGGTMTLSAGTNTSVYVSVSDSEVWSNYVASWRVKGSDEFELLFYRSTEDDQYFVRVTTAGYTGGGSYGKIELYSNVAGTPTQIQSVTLPYGFAFEDDVYHTIRVEVDRYITQNEIRVFLDAEQIMSEVDNDHSSGTIGIRNHVTAANEVVADEIEMFFLPAATDFIDINERE